MKIYCLKKDLNEAVSSAQRAVSNKSILTVLEGILITAKDDKIILRGNDMEMGIEYTVTGKIEQEGSVVLTSRYFSEIVRKFPEDEIEINCDENFKVHITCQNSTIDLIGLNPQGFPEIPSIDEENTITLKQEILRNMIKQVVFSVSIDEKMPVLTGSLLETAENCIYMVAIDGYRMSYRKEYLLGTKEGVSVVIPGKALNEVARLLKNDDEDVSIHYGKNQILFNFGNCKLITKLLQGDYLNYKSIYPENYDTEIEVNTKQILASVDRANLVITEDKRTPVKFEIDDLSMIITSATDIGKVEETISIKKEGNDLSIAFNPKFIMDALKNIEDEVIKISFSGSIGPCVISALNSDEFSYVILPVRTN
ncbi:MAG: DNA polymerase III subunit beta [Clostridiales bacterium]|nr:DNA polymerase III subunit beta [Clostridiales bacterium]